MFRGRIPGSETDACRKDDTQMKKRYPKVTGIDVVPKPWRAEDEEEDGGNDDEAACGDVDGPALCVLQAPPETKDGIPQEVLVDTAERRLALLFPKRRLPITGVARRVLGRRGQGLKLFAALHLPVGGARIQARHQETLPQRPRGPDGGWQVHGGLVSLVDVQSQIPRGGRLALL
jgi:hypothetical protein